MSAAELKIQRANNFNESVAIVFEIVVLTTLTVVTNVLFGTFSGKDQTGRSLFHTPTGSADMGRETV